MDDGAYKENFYRRHPKKSNSLARKAREFTWQARSSGVSLGARGGNARRVSG